MGIKSQRKSLLYLNSPNRNFSLSKERQRHREEDVASQLEQVEILYKGKGDFRSDSPAHHHEGDHCCIQNEPFGEHAQGGGEAFDHGGSHYEVYLHSEIKHNVRGQRKIISFFVNYCLLYVKIK